LQDTTNALLDLQPGGATFMLCPFDVAWVDRPSITDLLAEARSGVLLFGLTPPRRSATADQVDAIAARTLARLERLDLDGLVLYDIDDESDRNTEERPFPYLPTMDPSTFNERHLTAWKRPTMLYRSVGKYQPGELAGWLDTAGTSRTLTVFVGPSSRNKPVRCTLAQAYALRSCTRPELPLGGVVVPERHTRTSSEHRRMLDKLESGCTFS
jgi:hypothetical protein